MRRWLQAHRKTRELEQEQEQEQERVRWARERAADLRFARASWRAYTRKESQEVR